MEHKKWKVFDGGQGGIDLEKFQYSKVSARCRTCGSLGWMVYRFNIDTNGRRRKPHKPIGFEHTNQDHRYRCSQAGELLDIFTERW